jgi:hypothetical protein
MTAAGRTRLAQPSRRASGIMTFPRSRRIRTGGALTLASGLAPAAASTSRALFIAGYHFTAPRGHADRARHDQGAPVDLRPGRLRVRSRGRGQVLRGHRAEGGLGHPRARVCRRRPARRRSRAAGRLAEPDRAPPAPGRADGKRPDHYHAIRGQREARVLPAVLGPRSPCTGRAAVPGTGSSSSACPGRRATRRAGSPAARPTAGSCPPSGPLPGRPRIGTIRSSAGPRG